MLSSDCPAVGSRAAGESGAVAVGEEAEVANQRSRVAAGGAENADLPEASLAVAQVEGFHEACLSKFEEAIAHRANRLSPPALASAGDGHLLL